MTGCHPSRTPNRSAVSTMAPPLHPTRMPFRLSGDMTGPGQTNPGQDDCGPHRAPEVPLDGLAQFSADATGQCLAHEPDVGGQIRRSSHLSEGLNLSLVHEEAASPEVPPRRPRRRNEVLDPCQRLVDDLFRWTLMHEAMAHVHVVVVVGVKTTDVRQGHSSHRHVCSDESRPAVPGTPEARNTHIRTPSRTRTETSEVEVPRTPAWALHPPRRRGRCRMAPGAAPTNPDRPMRRHPRTPRCRRGRARPPYFGPNRDDLGTCWPAPPPGPKGWRFDAPSADGTVREGRRCDRRRQ